MLPSPPKHQGFVTRKLQAQLKPVAAAQASDDATSVEALVVREEVSTKLFDPSPPRRRNDNNSSGGGGASTSGTSPLVDITNKRLTENRVKLAVHSMTTQDAPHDTTLHVTPIKQFAWFPSEQSPVDGCTLVMLSSVPRLLMTSSPEACFKAPAVTERAAASTAATVVRGSNAASVSPVPCRTLPRRNVEPAVTAVVVSAGINTTPRRGLVVNDNDVSANSASVTRWESPSLLKQRHMRQLVQGALFDHGVVGSVSPQRLALLMSEGRSPNPGEVVMFDGVAAVVGDPSKIRFTPKPPPRPLLV